MFDQWVAGYAHGVSGGITTAIRREDYGEIQEGDHAFLWNMGNLAGISTSFILGFQLPAALAGQMGATKWGTTFATGIAAAGEGYGIYEAGMGLADGQWDYTDVFNLLSLVPYAVPAVTGVANSLGTMRAANRAAGGVADDVGRAAGSVDDMLRSSQKTQMATDIPNPSACFVAGTEILTPEGKKDIEDIEVGDWVIADDPTTPGEIEKRQVLQTFVRETDVLVDLYVDGEVISTTEEHPFWVPDKGWVEAGDLQVGDLLTTEDGIIIDIDWIGKREGDFEVYNFEVEDFHTYFVSDLEILVHNACVYTTTNSRVDLNRPQGTYVTKQNLLDGVTLYQHISRNVPPTSKRRGQGFLDFVTEIDVPEEALQVDPGGIPDVTAWIPPNTDGARITREWRVIEVEIGDLPVFELLEK